MPKPDDLLRLAEALAGEVSERACGGAPSYVYCCKLADGGQWHFCVVRLCEPIRRRSDGSGGCRVAGVASPMRLHPVQRFFSLAFGSHLFPLSLGRSTLLALQLLVQLVVVLIADPIKRPQYFFQVGSWPSRSALGRWEGLSAGMC